MMAMTSAGEIRDSLLGGSGRWAFVHRLDGKPLDTNLPNYRFSRMRDRGGGQTAHEEEQNQIGNNACHAQIID